MGLWYDMSIKIHNMSQVEKMHRSGQPLIGPNAIIQTVHSLRSRYGTAEANDLLQRSGQGHLVEQLPEAMVDETAFHSLVDALLAQLGESQTGQILQEAGQRTADYLLAHRIPRFFQRLVSVQPRRIGLALLLAAIRRHAWTFVGSGQFHFTITQRPTIHIRVVCPSVPPVAHFYGGTFARLVCVLIDRQTSLETVASQDAGGINCIYTLTLSGGQAA